MTEIEAVVCDLDGTLVLSEELHLEAWNEMLRRFGYAPPGPHWNEDCVGLPDTYARDKTLGYFPELADKGDINEMKQTIFREMVAEKGAALAMPGIHEMLDLLKRAGFRLAVGTNSKAANCRASLKAAGIEKYFTEIVTLDQVKKGKPHPDIYSEAARRLGVAPERCAVLEDSTAGIEAGKSAGCLVLGLKTTWPEGKLAAADRIFENTASALRWVLNSRGSRRLVACPI